MLRLILVVTDMCLRDGPRTPVAPMGPGTVTVGTMPGTTPVAPMGAGTMTTGTVSPTMPGVVRPPAMVPGGTMTVNGTTPAAGGTITLAPNPPIIRRPIDPSQLRQPPPPVPSGAVLIQR